MGSRRLVARIMYERIRSKQRQLGLAHGQTDRQTARLALRARTAVDVIDSIFC